MVAEVYKALIEAGASEDSARAAASAIPVAKDLGTKQDIAEQRAELKQDIAELRAELKQDIAELRAELKQDIAELRAEVKQDIAELKSDLKILKAIYGPVVIGLLLAIAGMVFRLVFFSG
jgi:small-conductance mechanosensitive channel